MIKRTTDLSQLNSYLLPFALCLLFISGCAGPQKEVKKLRYFFPPSPEPPKIEWLGRYASQHDIPKTPAQKFRESIFGQEPPKSFRMPWGIAADGEGKVYVTDSQMPGVIVYDLNEGVVRKLGARGEQDEGYNDLFSLPLDAAVDLAGNIYVVDQRKKAVYVFTKDETPKMTMGQNELEKPTGIGIDSTSNRAYVADSGKNSIAVFDLSTGEHLFSFGKKGNEDGEFTLPGDVTVGSRGEVVVLDSGNARVQIFDKEGKFIRKFGRRGDNVGDFQMPKSIAANKEDILFISEARHDRVMLFRLADGQSLMTFGARDTSGKVIGGFYLPRGLFIDKSERLYVVDALGKKFTMFQIVNEDWLKSHPLREEEVAKPAEEKPKEKKK